MQAGARWLGKVALLAAAYYVTGRLGLLLAIPPGFVTAVFPPSGIALAGVLVWGYRVWPGILIGSFLMNVGVSLDLQELARSAVLAGAIGSGASLQACVGAAAIRRVVGFPTPLDTWGDVVAFLGLGGPVASVVNATVGSTALLVSGSIDASGYPFSWWTWWVGDTMGVLTVTPLVLVFAAEPRRIWRARWYTVALPLATMFALSAMVFVWASALERRQIQQTFDERADVIVDDITNVVNVHTEIVQSLASFVRSSEEVLPPEFATFTDHVLKERSGIQALLWNPRVADTQREEFETYARRVRGGEFTITELAPDGSLRPRGPSDEYFPALYVEPLPGNEEALGFDVGSEAVRRAALEQARRTDAEAATARLQLVQGMPGQVGFQLFVPVRSGDGLQGFAVGAFVVSEVIGSAVDTDISGMRLTVLDESARGAERDVFRWDGRPGRSGDVFSYTASFDVADRRWSVNLAAGPAFLERGRSFQAWVILAAGMFFSGLLGMSLLILTGRTDRVQALVAERTGELRRVNRHLEEARADLEARVTELARSNAELERFAYLASHDLQEPLRAVAAHTQLLQRRYGGRLGPDADESIGYAVEGAKRMRSLIDGLLMYSRLGRGGSTPSAVDVGDVLERVRKDLGQVIRESDAEIVADDLPTVRGDAVELARLFGNLIDNSIKFAGDRRPRVTIGAERRGDDWELSISDEGIGFEPEYGERIFRMFERLHPVEAYPGTGIGLAIVRRVVELHGGRVWAESRPGGGATFRFTLPAADADDGPGQPSSESSTSSIP